MTLDQKASNMYFESISTDKVRSQPYFPIFSKAKGSWFYDVNGKEYFDGTSGSGVVNLGHQHPRVMEAVQKQIGNLIHTSCKFPSDIRREMIQKLGQFSIYEKCSILPTVSGTESIEAAFKVARAYTKRKAIVSFVNAYHGKTSGALNVTWREEYRKFSEEPSNNFYCTKYPLLHTNDPDDSAEACLELFKQTMSKACEEGHAPAAVILEPIQIVEGILAAGKYFLENLIKIAHSFETLVIFDEIFTGFGRTGEKFYACKLNEKPDIMLVGKGLGNGFPITAVVAAPEIVDSLPLEMHTSTYSAHPISCAAACSVIEEMNEKTPWIKGAEKGKQIYDFIKSCEQKYSFVNCTRGEGMLHAFDCLDKDGKPCSAIAKDFIKLALEKRMILLNGGYRECTIRIIPPLTIEDNDMDFLLSNLEDIIKELNNKKY